MATWLEKSRSPEYSPAKLSQMLAEVEAVIGIDELDEAMAHETIIIGGYLNTHLIKAKSIVTEQLDVKSLSGISADLGEITSGIITGAIVRTASGEDRIEFSPTDSVYSDIDTLKGFYNGTKRVELTHRTLNFYDDDGVYAGGIIAVLVEDDSYHTSMNVAASQHLALSADPWVASLDNSAPMNTSHAYIHVNASEVLNDSSIAMEAFKWIQSQQAYEWASIRILVDNNDNPTIRCDANDFYVTGTVSAQAYIDRTPFYEGDALSEVVKIKGIDGELDHKSLPSFVRVATKKPAEKIAHTQRNEMQKESISKNGNRNVSLSTEIDDEEIEGRDLGAMVSMLTRAVQQLKSIVDEQQAQINELIGGIKNEKYQID